MSRFLKFIVHLVVICVIIVALGLTIPPFFGVRTVVVDDPNAKTNLPMGSVTYAIPVKSEDVYQGDPILVEEDGNTYRYNIESINLANGTGVVKDQSVTDSKDITVAINRGYVQKVVITIGYVGYLQVATKSMEGLIILGLVLLFLIILYVIAELWKKDDSSDDDYDEDYEDSGKSKRQLKKEAKAARKEQAEEYDEDSRAARKARKKAEKRKVHTGGFVDDIDEEDDEEEYVPQNAAPVTQQPAEEEAHEYLRQEVAAANAAAADEPAEEEEVSPLASIAPEALEEVELDLPDEPEPDDEPEPFFDDVSEEPEIKEIRKRAIPGWNSSQLAREAASAGESPDVFQDDITDVTLFDYSDLLDEDTDEE